MSTNEPINSRALAMEADLEASIVDYVHAVFQQVHKNQQDWGVQNTKKILKLEEKVRALEIEVANLKARL